MNAACNVRGGRRASWPRIELALVAFGIVLVAGLWVRTAIRIDGEHEDAINDATRQASALALAFEEHTTRNLEQIDRQLLDTTRAYLHDGNRVDLPRVAASIPADAVPFRDLAVVNKEGRRVLAVGGTIPGDVSTEEYFIAQRDGRSRATFVGRPSQDPRSGKWAIPVSRRIDNADGTFGGVVVATIDAARFTRFLRRVDLGSDGIVALVGVDGFARVRETARAVSFGQDMRESTLFRELPRRSTGDFAGEGKLDGVRRFYSFRTLAHFPLVIIVGISQAEALAPFHARELNYILAAVLGTALIAAFIAGIAAALRRQKRSMDLLAEAQSRYQEIFDNTRDCIFVLVITPEGRFRIEGFNPAEEAATGLSLEASVGRFVEEVLPKPLAQTLDANYRRCLELGVPINYEETLDLPRGRRHFDTTLIPIRDHGDGLRRIVGVAHDITTRKESEDAIRGLKDSLEARVRERTAELAVANEELARQKERAELASKAKGAFLATVSHEIRTPINGLLGALELLGQARLERADAELLAAARASGNTLLALLNDLLDMAKIEAGRVELVCAPHSLQAIVERTMSTHRVNARRKGLQIRSSIDALAPEWVLIDDLRVTQILGNLVSNAIKFTSKGDVSLDVAVLGQRPGACRLRFRVADTGAGMDAATLERLFRPFEQGAAGRNAGGTGLGLAISHGLAELMGATISFQSAPGSGTIADFELEVSPAQREPVPPVQPELIRVPVAKGTRVLVVDDHPTNRMVLTRQLEQLGCIVEQCEDGEQALGRFDAARHDIVITDCEMPLMDGYELTRAIRAREGEGRRAPIIAYTAHAMTEIAVRCHEAGMDAVLHKPVMLGELAQVLAAHGPPAQEGPVHGGSRLAAAAPALDPSHLALLTGGDAGLEREFLAHFRAACGSDAAALRLAVDARDGAEAARVSHRIKGASRTIGAFALAAACEQVERAARAADWNRVAQCLCKLEEELKGVIVDAGDE
ncbi:MAG TPA: response regulator [Usitatibacter sp.]|nr:response regulator [Usitatibacter sp.]